jgi:hypothetical protein
MKNSMLKWLELSPNPHSQICANLALEMIGEALNALKVLKRSQGNQPQQALNAMERGGIYSTLSQTSRYCFCQSLPEYPVYTGVSGPNSKNGVRTVTNVSELAVTVLFNYRSLR